MRKAQITVDMLISFLLLLFLFLWLQNSAATLSSGSESYGAQAQAKTAAVNVGSQMNAFYATSPGAGDYLDLPAMRFGFFKSMASTYSVEKTAGVRSTIFKLMTDVGAFSSNYPVAGSIKYAAATDRVTE
jgi:hypothetical protein